ncbi:MAG: sortase [Ilumatobacteraceae bacterium]
MSEGGRTTTRPPPSRPRKPHRIFDRAPQPHDWRWVVAGIGRVLIVAGLMMFAFVAYQLWGTGVYTAQAQNRLDSEFNKMAVTTSASPTTVASTGAPGPTGTSTSASTSSPEVTTTIPAEATTTSTSNAPDTTDTTDTTAVSDSEIAYPFGKPHIGDPLVRIQIPRIGIDFKVVEGVGLAQLADGPGHFPESVLPGQLGNSAIAGHRTSHLAPFENVDKLRPGDQIVITYPKVGNDSPHFVYLVTGTEIVSASSYAAVVPTTDPTKATLVLASCHPKYTSTNRIIIRSELAADQSSPLFTATPVAGPPSDPTIPGDDQSSTTAAATSVPMPTVPTESTIAGQALPPASTTTGPTESTVSSTTGQPTASTIPAASEDAFAGGWFNDASAWPHIVFWLVALIAIAYGSYRLARRTRRIWFGSLVGLAPFVFVLYFFFENVNRLLPPGL